MFWFCCAFLRPHLCETHNKKSTLIRRNIRKSRRIPRWVFYPRHPKTTLVIPGEVRCEFGTPSQTFSNKHSLLRCLGVQVITEPQKVFGCLGLLKSWNWYFQRKNSDTLGCPPHPVVVTTRNHHEWFVGDTVIQVPFKLNNWLLLGGVTTQVIHDKWFPYCLHESLILMVNR